MDDETKKELDKLNLEIRRLKSEQRRSEYEKEAEELESSGNTGWFQDTEWYQYDGF